MTGRLLDFLFHHPYFSVQEIRVAGGGKVGGAEIVTMTGLRHGMNIWRIDPKSIEAKVSNHPWVKRVLVRREFPQRVIIQVEEWVAKGIVVLGRLYYVDADGFIFKEVARGEKVNLPLITGLRRSHFLSHSSFARKRIVESLRLSDLFRKSSISLSEIHFDPQGGIVIYPILYPVTFAMGWGDWAGKLLRLKRVLEEWRGKEDRLTSIDLRFRDQVVVRFRKGVTFSSQRSVTRDQPGLTSSKGL